MNKKIKGKVSTIFMLVVLMAQALTPMVSVFAEDLTADTVASSEIQELDQSSAYETRQQEGVTNNSSAEIVPKNSTVNSESSSTLPSGAVQSDTVSSTVTDTPMVESSEVPTSESQEVATTEESAEEDEEPARESTSEVVEETITPINEQPVSDILELLTGVTANIQIDGKWQPFEHNGSIEVDPELLGGLNLKYEFNLIPNVIELEAGKEYVIDLPTLVKVTEEKTWQNEEKNIDFRITTDGKVIIVFSKDFVEKDKRNFEINIDLVIDKKVFEEERYQKVEIGYGDNKIFESEIIGDGDKIKGEDNKKGFTYIVEGDEKKETTVRPTHADWTVTVNSGINRYESAKIKDTIGDGHTLVKESIVVTKVVRNKVTGEVIRREPVTLPEGAIQVEGQTFTIDMGDISDTYEVSYTTEIKEGAPGTENTIKNNAVIILDGTETTVSDEIKVSWGKEYPTIKKTSPGIHKNYIDWEINYNYANEDFGVDPLVFTDKLSAGSYFDLKELNLVVQEMSLDREGNPIAGAIVTETVSATLNEQGHLVLSIPNSKGKGYKITYRSLLKGGLENTTIKNEVVVNDPENSNDSADQVVNTKPSLDKSSQVVIIDGEAHINWTVVFNKDAYAFDNFTLVDTYNKAYLELVRNSVQVDGKDLTEAMTFTETDSGFTLTVSPAEAKQYRLTYQTKVTDEGLLNKITNKVDWGNGPGVGTGEVDPGEIKPGIKKEGKYSLVEGENRQQIDWKITFNHNKLILKNAVLTDTFNPADLKVIGEPVIKADGVVVDAGKYTYTPTKDGFTITFNENIEPKVYTIEYSTNAPDKSNVDSINTATLKWQGKEDSAQVTVPKRTPGVEKLGETVVNEDGKKQNNWTIKFNKNHNIIYNLKLTDTFTPESSEIIDGLAGVKIIKEDQTPLVPGTDYKIDFKDDKTSQFIVEFLKETAPITYTMTYSTTYTPADETKDAVNKVDLSFLGGNESTDKMIPRPTLIVEKQVTNLDKTKDPKILSWQINANTDAAKHHVSLVNATLTDTILADQKYVEGSMKIVRKDQPDVDLDESTLVKWNGATFTINLPDGPYEYIVTYDTEIVAYPAMNQGTSGKYDRYYNEVLLTNTPIAGQESETAKASAYKDYFDDGSDNNSEKSGEQNPETDNMDWTIQINPAGLPIRDAKIQDTLDEYQEYLEDSVKLTLNNLELKKDDDYTIDFSENEQKNKAFTIVLKERKTNPGEVEGGISYNYQLTYSTKLRDDVKGIFDVINEFAILGNTTAGWTETITGTTTAEKWTYGGSGSAVTIDLEGKKIDADRPELTLAGVKFKLDRVTGKNPEKLTAIRDEILTDSQGALNVEKIRSGRYILEETQERIGYHKIPKIHFILGYDENGKEVITLTNDKWVEEENPHVSVEDGVLIIRNTQIKTDISATKVWSENSPQQKPTIWFTLYSRIAGTTVEGQAVSGTTKVLKSGTEKVTWWNLPTHNDASEELEYYVKETDESGKPFEPEYYEKSEEGLVVTNTFIDRPITWKATKVWEDYGDKHFTRPEAIYVQLLQNEVAFRDVMKITGSKLLNVWEYTFEDLPPVNMTTGEIYRYTVQEVNEQGEPIDTLGDYEVNSDGQTITNTLKNITEVKGLKVWDDFDNKDQLRPTEITINLLQNGQKIREVTTNAANDWAYEFTELVKYDEAGNLYQYTVSENDVDNYTATIDGTTITNTYRGFVELSGNKTWQDNDNQFGIRPETITINLLQNGQPIEQQVIGAAEDWQYTFTELVKYDEQGELYEYTVSEEAVNGYESTIDQAMGEITNRLITTDLRVNKGWDDFDNQYGLRPTSIQVYLLQNGKRMENIEHATIKPDEKGNWQYRFTDLPKFDSQGEEYQYTIEEEAVTGYDSTIIQTLEEVEGELQFNIVNQLVTVNIPVSKKWSDNDNQHGLRPDMITVRLLQNGKEIEFGPAIELNEENEWQSTFVDLPKFDKSGALYEYTLSEDAVNGYETTIDQATGVITNTLSTTEIIGEKLWEDWNDTRKHRPESITVNLLQNGKELTSIKVVPDKKGDWHFAFNDLPKFDATGKLFEYTVTEDKVANYQPTIEQKDNFVTITNKYFGKLPSTGGDTEKPKPTKPGKTLPQTGEIVNPLLTIIGLLMVSSVIIVILFKRYRKQ